MIKFILFFGCLFSVSWVHALPALNETSIAGTYHIHAFLFGGVDYVVEMRRDRSLRYWEGNSAERLIGMEDDDGLPLITLAGTYRIENGRLKSTIFIPGRTFTQIITFDEAAEAQLLENKEAQVALQSSLFNHVAFPATIRKITTNELPPHRFISARDALHR